MKDKKIILITFKKFLTMPLTIWMFWNSDDAFSCLLKCYSIPRNKMKKMMNALSPPFILAIQGFLTGSLMLLRTSLPHPLRPLRFKNLNLSPISQKFLVYNERNDRYPLWFYFGHLDRYVRFVIKIHDFHYLNYLISSCENYSVSYISY